MRLYHCKDARSLRPLWTLEEMELDYELINMEFPPRATYPGYLDLNPLGTVPTFYDGGQFMSESSGICHYIVSKYGPTEIALTPEEPQYGEYLNWLYMSDATLTFPQTLVLRYSTLEKEDRRIPQVVQDYSIWYLSRLRFVETTLADREFLLGERFTIADIAVGYALFLGTRLGLRDRYKPHCNRYLQTLTDRPAFKSARNKQLSLTPIST